MMKSQNSAIGRSHVVWLDVVRFVAMFTVVCCHSADPFNFYPGEPPANIDQIKFWGAAYGSFLRPCVPLFVMITGALLLPLKDDTSVFYKKRISRVFWPFLIWSVLYNLFPWITGQLGLSPEVILDFFPYSGEEVARQSLDVSLRYIAGGYRDWNHWTCTCLVSLPGWKKPLKRPSYGFCWPGACRHCCLITISSFHLMYGEAVPGTPSICCIILPGSTAICF